MNEQTIQQLKKCYQDGISTRKTAKLLNVSKSAVGRYFYKFAREKTFVEINSPRILLLDIETAPAKALAFGRFKQNLTQDHILEEGGWLISIAWKWLGDDTTFGKVLIPVEALLKEDIRLINDIVCQINEADVVIGHNIDGFDIPKIKARMIKHGLKPFKTVKTIDTLKIAKRLGFPSNKLDSLASFLDIGRKVQHQGISLWKGCTQGDEIALQDMQEYNIADVELLEKVYLKLRAYDTMPPNIGKLYNEEVSRCPVCGSTDLTTTGNLVHTPVSTYDEVVCNCCGHRSRKRKVVNSKEARSNVLITHR